MAGQAVVGTSGVSVSETLEHLETVLQSAAFVSSRRCQEFLRFVVRETVEGRGSSLKERTIALGVFGKGARFEPSEDSLVRVKAREVRKRLAEYYECDPDSVVRIELPLGGYVPNIYLTARPSAASAQVIPPVADPIHLDRSKAESRFFTRRKLLWTLGASLGTAATAPMLLRYRPAPMELLWRPIFATKMPLLIYIPLLPSPSNGELTDRVGLGTAVAVSRAADYLTMRRYPYRLRFGADLTFSQLREQPSLLLGGFSSAWTDRMTRGLRFNLNRNDGGEGAMFVVDTQTGRKWGPIYTRNGYSDEDYAILCRLFDSSNGQVVFMAAGITTFGTESAAEYFFNPSLFSQLMKQAPSHWETKNFQAVIRVSVIGTTPSSGQLVASYFW